MTLRILTLNIWRYYDWKKRKTNLINFLKEQNADIILLQEAAYDERLKSKYKNQIDEINKSLNYKFNKFGRLVRMTKWHKEPINGVMYFGFGILSKHKIVSAKVIKLKPINIDRKMGFMYITLRIKQKNKNATDIDILNVHFENNNEGAKEQLRQTILWCKKKKINPIIAGDFNIKIFDDLKELARKDFNISYNIKKYFSFYPTEHSFDKVPITLDYILSDKKKFKMSKVMCMDTKASDHKAVLAEIKLNV